jgi:uncharacterized SAM-dependent methyltransferase
MQLVSRADQTAHVHGEAFHFARGEVITTEYSHKYTIDGFADLAGQGGFEVVHVWTDPRRYFSVQYLRTAAAR